jgi:hypothetical protein
MDTGIKMKRTASLSKAKEHQADNAFCAAHPDRSSRSASQVIQEETHGTYRRVEMAEPRAHVSAEHVLLAKKRK